MNNINLSNMSADALEALAKKAKSLAEDLREKQPSYALALEAGVKDESYQTVRYGRIEKYSGEAVVKMADGSRWLCKGHGTKGNAHYVSREGYIEFIPMGKDDETI